VHPGVKANNVRELVAVAKAQPGKLAYGSTGGGAASHLSAELFNSMAQTDVLHVPYKGTANAITDLLGGHVQMMFAPPRRWLPM
jgi:tripartite-type tricarboxylate transporter receptor subunit TctC